MKPSIVLAASVLLAGTLAQAASFTVTTTGDSGPGSLRQAILNANTNSDFDEIDFGIEPSGIHVIVPSERLPVIVYPVWTRGETQPGYASAGTPQVELDGRLAACAAGLFITAGHSTAAGLAVHSFKFCFGYAESGIQNLLMEGGTNRIVGCYLGLTALGGRPTDPAVFLFMNTI